MILNGRTHILCSSQFAGKGRAGVRITPILASAKKSRQAQSHIPQIGELTDLLCDEMGLCCTTEHKFHMRTPSLLNILLELDNCRHDVRVVDLNDQWDSTLRQEQSF